MKIYISQPFAYLKNEDIIETRNDIIRRLKSHVKDIVILTSYVYDEQSNDLKELSKSIAMLSHADSIVFAPGWEKSRGCRIEHNIAEEFNIPIIEL